MSRCDLMIRLDDPDRVYVPGDQVTGAVHVDVNKDVTCRSLDLIQRWETHGRGNRTGDEINRISLFNGEWKAGEQFSCPFEMIAPEGPLTYRGHYLNIDHILEAKADIPWAFDPSATKDYLLSLGDDPYNGPRPANPDQPEATSPTFVIGCYSVLIAVALIIGAVINNTVAWAICSFATFGLLFLGISTTLPLLRVGKTEVECDNDSIEAGQNCRFKLRFFPKSTFNVNHIKVQLQARERVVKGSGSNRTTYKHELLSREHFFAEGETISGGRPHEFDLTFNVPDIGAYSFDASDNEIEWKATVEIDIPKFPDWSLDFDLLVLPPTGGQVLPTPAQSPAAKESDWNCESESHDFQLEPIEPEPVTGEDLAKEREWDCETEDHDVTEESVPQPSESEPSAPASPAAASTLTAIAESIQATDPYGPSREKAVDQYLGSEHAIAIKVERTQRNFTIDKADPMYGGRTVFGKLLDGGHPVEIHFPESKTDEIETLRSGQEWQGTVRIHDWSSLYNRFELHAKS